MVQDTGRRAEAVRDLKSQIAELSGQDAAEVVFIDVSPRRQRVTLYRMDTGEPVPVPAYMVEGIMANAKLPSGGFAFTSDASKAPEYKLGTVKCFLHPDSPERPVLEEIGLGYAFCPAAHLPNEYEKRLHGQHRHRKQWDAYQDYLARQERKKQEDRQDKQLEATLAMARAAGGQPVELQPGPVVVQEIAPQPVGEQLPCACGWKTRPDSKNPASSLQTHRNLHCELRERK